MKFNLKEYNESHNTDSPIRNKWFKFFRVDDSKCPIDTVVEYPKEGSFVEKQREYQKISNEVHDQYAKWMDENHEDTLVRVTSPFKIWLALGCNAPVNQFPFTLIFFFLQHVASVDYIVIPDLYLGKNKFVLKLERGFLWIISKLLFGWVMVWLYTVTLLAIIGNSINYIILFFK